MILNDFIYSFEFWDGIQNPVPNVWEVVFPNISIEGGVVYIYVHGLLDGPGQAVFLSVYNFKVLHCCIMATAVLMSKNWRWGLQMFLKFITKCSSWFSYIFFLTVNPPTTVTVNDTVLIGHSIFIPWWHQDVLSVCPPLKCTATPCFFTYVLYTFTYALCIWNHNVAFFGGIILCRGMFLLLSLMFLGNLPDRPFGIFTLAKYLL